MSLILLSIVRAVASARWSLNTTTPSPTVLKGRHSATASTLPLVIVVRRPSSAADTCTADEKVSLKRAPRPSSCRPAFPRHTDGDSSPDPALWTPAPSQTNTNHAFRIRVSPPAKLPTCPLREPRVDAKRHMPSAKPSSAVPDNNTRASIDRTRCSVHAQLCNVYLKQT